MLSKTFDVRNRAEWEKGTTMGGRNGIEGGGGEECGGRATSEKIMCSRLVTISV